MRMLAQLLTGSMWCLVQRKVEDWKKNDISMWLAVLDMTKYENSFKNVSGKVRKKGSRTFAYLASRSQVANVFAEAVTAVGSRCLQIC